MTIRQKFEDLNRLGSKKLLIIKILADYYSPAELLGLIDELLAELET